MKYRFKKQLRSFKHAWNGLRGCIGKEQNLSFHLIVAALTLLAGWLLGISGTEWMVVMLCIGLVIAAELFNTALERVLDRLAPERHPLTGQAKDIAAAAVLVCALSAAVVGILLFTPYIIRLF
ncbi:MAG: diacylglycerol kinase family protein [Prevotellaceae bacterium]|jgi:diacylglycerol kinase (ATP)|nr:diacylglycerol kinase family protein [Prevotellaceae bacterium]